jgi:hypothetical protein
MAGKSNNQSFSEIVSIDPVSLQSYKYAKNEIQPFRLEKSNKNSFFISYIQSKDVISATVDISRNIADGDIKDAIEIKVYDELGLDSAVEYTITYLETETNDTKNRIFNVFVIDATLIGAQLSEIRKKTSYIDYVTTAPFLISSLYQKALLESDGTDCFVYFQKNDAFLAIYRGGEYLYSKSLHYSLTELTEKFCELIGERIDEEDFYKLLTTEGLKSTNISYQSFLMQLFGELFLYINDVIVFAKRSYDIENIDKIYIGSEVGMFIGVDEYAKSYLGLESYEFNFSIAINSKEWYVDQIHILMTLTSQVYFENRDDKLNFSIYKRPPPFKERPVGKLIGIIAASIILSVAYPAYQYGYSQFLQIQVNQATKEYKLANSEANIIRAKIAKLKKDRAKIVSLVKKESDKLNFRKKLLTEIHKKKTQYSMKSLILVELIEISNYYKSKISVISYKENQISLSIQNRSEKKITEFIQKLTKLKKYKITTDKIEKDTENDLYLSQIVVGL